MFQSTAFGLRLRSNLPLPGLLPEPASEPSAPALATVDVHLGSLPAGLTEAAAHSLYDTPELTLRSSGDHILFAYEDGTRVAVRSDGREVWSTWPPELTLEDTATYLLGPVVAFVLRLLGRLSLHAAVFAPGSSAVAVAGGPQAGKSTLAAALALRGVRVLSDDVAALQDDGGRLLVHPSYPRVRLWDDSVTRLFGAADALPRLTPNWEKRFLDLVGRGMFERRALPLGALVVVDDRPASAGTLHLERMGPREAFVAVLAQIHSVWMLPRSPQRDVFRLAARLAERTPTWRLVAHRDPALLDRTCELLVGLARDPESLHVSAL